MAGGDHDDRRVEWLSVGGVGSDDDHGVSGDGDEELVVEGRVDEAEENRLARIDGEGDDL